MPTKARGAIARIPGAPVEIEDFIIDGPGPNDVLVCNIPTSRFEEICSI